MVCQRCGHSNADNVAYCVHCGSRLYVNVANGNSNVQPYVQSAPAYGNYPAQQSMYTVNHYAPSQDSKAKKKVSNAKTIAIVAIVMGIVSLVSIVAGFFYPVLWLLVLLLPIPTIVCAVVSNSMCRKYKNDSEHSDSVKTIRSFNRLAKLGAILTMVLTMLLIIGIIVVVLVGGITAFSDAVSALGGIFENFSEIVDTISDLVNMF